MRHPHHSAVQHPQGGPQGTGIIGRGTAAGLVMRNVPGHETDSHRNHLLLRLGDTLRTRRDISLELLRTAHAKAGVGVRARLLLVAISFLISFGSESACAHGVMTRAPECCH